MRPRQSQVTSDQRRAFAAGARVMAAEAEALGRGWLAYDLSNGATGEEALANLEEETDV